MIGDAASLNPGRRDPFSFRGGSILVKRSFPLIVLFVAALALPRPASAQYFPNIWGSDHSSDLDIQKLRNDQQARLQKYAAPVAPGTPDRGPGLSLGKPGPYGRVDLSGRPVTGYAAIRGERANFGPPQRRSSRPAPNVYKPSPRLRVPSRGLAIPPPPPIR